MKKNIRIGGVILSWLSVFFHLGAAWAVDSDLSNPPKDSNPVFNASINAMSPMTPEEIRKYRRYMKKKQKAMFDIRPPKFHQIQFVVKLHPGAMTPVVRISPMYSGAIYFSDETGGSWPVTEAKISSDKFQVEKPKTMSSNTLVVTSEKIYRSADLIVFLKGLDSPIALRVISDPKNTDLKTHLVIPRMGPSPRLPDVSGSVPMSSLVSETDERFVSGIPPKGAVRIASTNDDVSVWKYRGTYYVRTHYILASPAYIGLSRGDGSINLYKLVPTPVLIVSIGGKEVMVSLNDSSSIDAPGGVP